MNLEEDTVNRNPYRKYGQVSAGLDTGEYAAERYNDLLRHADAYRRFPPRPRVRADRRTSVLNAIARIVASLLW